jgi:Zn finger protein HypA/HybF involved in hydrogenase expression
MRTVTRYRDPITARQAASYLIAHGIVAQAVGVTDPFNPGADVEIADASLLEAARGLLEKFDLLKPEYLQPLEDQAVPDLTRLPSALAPTCPKCAAGLPLNAMIIHCPGCGLAVNVVDRIVELHGPEAIATCYPTDPDANHDLTDQQVSEMDLRCRCCQYSLSGLPVRGRCPECGRGYSKRDMLLGPGDTALCPGCQYSLEGLPLRGRCPECGEPYDKVDMLNSGVLGGTGQLPPEAEARRLTDEQIKRAPLACPRCRYSLDGLDVTGPCPECGRYFDKRELLHH